MSRVDEEFLCGETLAVGDTLPPLMLTVTARHIVAGAAASRDWQPQHHDRAQAGAMGLPDIIANTPTQAGWLCRYATDWSGPRGRIGRSRLRMLQPVCPGAVLTMTGRLAALRRAEQGWWWAWLTLELRPSAGGELLSAGELVLALPSQAGLQPWAAGAEQWHPPSLDAVAGG